MENTVKSQEPIPKNWVNQQIMTKEHAAAVLIFSLLAVSPLPLTVTGLAIIIIAVAIMRTPGILVMMAVVAVVSFIFPPLAAVLSFIFLFFKIKYILKHLNALVLGLLSTGYLWAVSSSYSPTVVLFLVSALGFHFTLSYLYKQKYSSSKAIYIMCSAPMYLLIVLLPIIIKELDLADSFSDDAFENYQQEAGREYQEVEDPGIHTVKGHNRHNSDGSVSYIPPHIRTNPDGVESNNLSSK